MFQSRSLVNRSPIGIFYVSDRLFGDTLPRRGSPDCESIELRRQCIRPPPGAPTGIPASFGAGHRGIDCAHPTYGARATAMDFSFNDRQQQCARRFHEIALGHQGGSDGHGFDWKTWQAISEAGLWRVPMPRDLGGVGGDWFEFTAAFEAMTHAMRSIGFSMAVANQATLIHCIGSMSTQAQRAELLPRLLDGEPCATAISERGTGTEIRALESTLIEVENGYQLNGHKYNVSLAPHASLILVAARFGSGPLAHPSLALIDARSPGLERSAAQDTLGVRDLPIGDLRFDAVPVGRERILGEPRHALKSLMSIASMNRAYFALICAAAVRPFLADALAYAAERTILDVPINTHQHVQRRLVDVRMRAERSRWMALAALGQLLDGDPAAIENCSIAKITAAQDLTQSTLDLLALHGSDGYRSGALATFVTDALAMISAGGTEEMHRRNVFAQMQRQRERSPSEAPSPSRPSGVEAAAA